MQYILNNISGTKIVETTISLLISLVFAFIAWLIKVAYEKRLKENQTIAEIERVLVWNNGVINDNKELLKQWIQAIKDYKPYTGSFSTFNLGSNIQTTILNLDFINKYIPVIFDLNRLQSDLSNLYESYSHSVRVLIETEIQTEEHLKNWRLYNDNLLNILEKILSKVQEIQDNITHLIAYSHELFNQNKYSVFQLITVLNRIIYPKIKEKNISKEKIKIEERILNNK